MIHSRIGSFVLNADGLSPEIIPPYDSLAVNGDVNVTVERYFVYLLSGSSGGNTIADSMSQLENRICERWHIALSMARQE